MKKVPQKKLYILVLFLAIILAFSGCGRKNGNEIEKLGNSEIEGKNRNATSSDNTATTTDENAEDTATSTDEIDTSDWKTYRNEEYGFELRYPVILELQEKEGYINFHNNCSKFSNDFKTQMQCSFQGDFSIAIIKEGLDEFIEDYKDDFLNGVPLTRIISRKDYSLDNILATKLEGTTAEGSGGLDHIFVIKDDKNYLISYNQHIENYVKMVETFKFLDLMGNTIKKFKNEYWYNDFMSQVKNLNRLNPFDYECIRQGDDCISEKITEEDIIDMQYLKDEDVVIAIIAGKYGGDGFKLVKYDLQSKTLEIAAREDAQGGQDTNWYKERDKAMEAAPEQKQDIYLWFAPPNKIVSFANGRLTLSGEDGDAGCWQKNDFIYDIEKNYIYIIRQCSGCVEETAETCINFQNIN